MPNALPLLDRADQAGTPGCSDPTQTPSRRRILVTGGAGFIGSHTAIALMRAGNDVIVVDEMNDYYDISIKEDNVRLLEQAAQRPGQFVFHRGDVADRAFMERLLVTENVEIVIHLAARAGVRASIENPDIYVHSNVHGTTVLFDLAHKYKHQIKHVIYASSSSVYGGNVKVPYSESDRTDDAVSPYAATKKACEVMAASYANMFQIYLTGLRFFTVYGPRGRPDMAPFKFVDRVASGKPIDKYGDGSSSRDYTYIDDIVQGILACLDRPQRFPHVHHTIYNLGNSSPISLNDFIALVERVVGRKALIRQLPEQTGDMKCTFADVDKAKSELGYEPHTSLEAGLKHLYAWWVQKYGRN
jgi:UDP-glucuronate 4-epimerase